MAFTCQVSSKPGEFYEIEYDRNTAWVSFSAVHIKIAVSQYLSYQNSIHFQFPYNSIIKNSEYSPFRMENDEIVRALIIDMCN